MAHAAHAWRVQGIITEDGRRKDYARTQAYLSRACDDGHGLQIRPRRPRTYTCSSRPTLTERIGDAGKELHTARSRNDQVALDMRLYLSADVPTRNKKLLLRAGARRSSRWRRHTPRRSCRGTRTCSARSPSPSRTTLLAYANDVPARFGQAGGLPLARMNASCPLGSGALAGTTYPTDRAADGARLLGFDGVLRSTASTASPTAISSSSCCVRHTR